MSYRSITLGALCGVIVVVAFLFGIAPQDNVPAADAAPRVEREQPEAVVEVSVAAAPAPAPAPVVPIEAAVVALPEAPAVTLPAPAPVVIAPAAKKVTEAVTVAKVAKTSKRAQKETKAVKPATRRPTSKAAASGDEGEDLDALPYDELVSRAHKQSRRDPRAALALYGKAAQKFPNRAEVSGWIASTYMRLGQFEAARASYAQCSRKMPGYGPCSFGQAKALDKLGRRGEALKLYASYVTFHPDGSQAAVAKERLAALGGGE